MAGEIKMNVRGDQVGRGRWGSQGSQMGVPWGWVPDRRARGRVRWGGQGAGARQGGEGMRARWSTRGAGAKQWGENSTFPSYCIRGW